MFVFLVLSGCQRATSRVVDVVCVAYADAQLTISQIIIIMH